MDQEKNIRAANDDDRQATVGIDVAKEKLDVALRLACGKVKTKVVPNKAAGFEALRAWLAKTGCTALTCAWRLPASIGRRSQRTWQITALP
jgi:hypothetical protein